MLASMPNSADPRGRRYRLDQVRWRSRPRRPRRDAAPTSVATWGGSPRRSRARPTGYPVSAIRSKTSRAMFQRLDPAIWTAASAPIPPALGRDRGGRRGQVPRRLLDEALRGRVEPERAAAHLVSVFAHRARLRARPARRSAERRTKSCVEDSPPLPAGAAAGHGGRDAHPDRDRELICHTLKSHYLMIVKSNQPKLLARVAALPWTQVPVAATDDAHATAASSGAPSKCSPATRGIGFPDAEHDHPDHPANASPQRPANVAREVVYAILQPPIRTPPAGDDRRLAARPLGIENIVHWVARRNLRRGPLHRAHRHRPRSWPSLRTQFWTCTASPEPTTSP